MSSLSYAVAARWWCRRRFLLFNDLPTSLSIIIYTWRLNVIGRVTRGAVGSLRFSLILSDLTFRRRFIVIWLHIFLTLEVRALEHFYCDPTTPEGLIRQIMLCCGECWATLNLDCTVFKLTFYAFSHYRTPGFLLTRYRFCMRNTVLHRVLCISLFSASWICRFCFNLPYACLVIWRINWKNGCTYTPIVAFDWPSFSNGGRQQHRFSVLLFLLPTNVVHLSSQYIICRNLSAKRMDNVAVCNFLRERFCCVLALALRVGVYFQCVHGRRLVRWNWKWSGGKVLCLTTVYVSSNARICVNIASGVALPVLDHATSGSSLGDGRR